MTEITLQTIRRIHPTFMFASIDEIAERYGVSPDCVRWLLRDSLLIEEGRPSSFSIEESIARVAEYYYPDGLASPGTPFWIWYIPMIVSIIEDRIGTTEKMKNPDLSTDVMALYRISQQKKKRR